MNISFALNISFAPKRQDLLLNLKPPKTIFKSNHIRECTKILLDVAKFLMFKNKKNEMRFQLVKDIFFLFMGLCHCFHEDNLLFLIFIIYRNDIVPFYIYFQLYVTLLVYHFGGIISYAIFESVEHLNLRFQHISERLKEILQIENPLERRKQFNEVVKYHYTLIE